MPEVPKPEIVTPNDWGARKAKQPPIFCGKPDRIIFHHTAGHAPGYALAFDESPAEAFAYARGLQAMHMDRNGWNDSGHNFLVCRNGMILVGRRFSLTRIALGLMVVSAHCVGQNRQPGIEHEHAGNEQLTPGQWDASVHLHAWICDRCGIAPVNIRPHSRYNATSCPGALFDSLGRFQSDVAKMLNRYGRHNVRPGNA